MRAVTFAAAGAAVIGGVSASGHGQHMHAKLHAARGWVETTPAKVEPAATSTTTVDWEDWSTTSLPVDPAVKTTTTTTVNWEDWSTTSLPVDPAVKTTTTTTTSTFVWEDWTTTTTTTKPVDPTTIESWADWTTTSVAPVDPATTSTVAWADWSSTDVDPASTSTEEWGDWDEDSTTLTTTTTTTVWIAPVSSDPVTWEDWETATTVTDTSTTEVWATETAVAAETTPVAALTSVITSTIAPAWTSSGWFGPSWTVAAGSCAVSVITSYGLPTWVPDPVAATTASNVTWADWTATTTTPVAAAATTTASWADWTTTAVPVDPVSTTTASWADWTTTAVPVDPVSTTTESWADWTTTTSVPVAAVSTSTETWADWTTTTSVPVAPASTSTETWADWSSGAAAPTGKPAGGAPGITSNGDSWGLTYSPYTAGGGCKDAGTIAQDLATIAQKGFKTVRVYSTDCNTLENFGPAAREHGLQLILGVWINASGISAAKGQIDDIIAWGQWDLVQLIVVGNESVFNGYCSASDLAGFIASSASAFKAAGYTGAVTTTEPLSVWQDSGDAGAFCAVVDVVSANLYAFFNAQVTADKAGGFIQSEIDILNTVCPGKSVYVLESGWPHAGNCNGAACPSPENQATALKGIQATVGAQVIFLSYEDEPWKEPGPFGVEQFWGCANVF